MTYLFTAQKGLKISGGNVHSGTEENALRAHLAGNLKVTCRCWMQTKWEDKLWLNGTFYLHQFEAKKIDPPYITESVMLRFSPNGVDSANYLYYIDGGNWVKSSSQELKTNIVPISDVLRQARSNPRALFQLEEENLSTLPGAQKQRHIGMIAEEVQAVFPELVSRAPDEDQEILGLDYSSFTAVLVQAVKELKALNQYLIKRMEALEALSRYTIQR